MGDFALTWVDGSADMSIDEDEDDVLEESGIKTAVLISLFTNRRAEPGDVLPSDQNDRGGWWGDEFNEPAGDLIGSRRWLLGRSKATSDIPALLEQYDSEALQWMLDDGVAASVDVTVEMSGSAISEVIKIGREGFDPETFRFEYVWAAEAA